MSRTVSRLLITTTALMNLAVTGYFAMRSWELLSALPELPAVKSPEHAVQAAADAHGAAPAAEGHGAAPAIGHEQGSAPLRSWVTLEEIFVNVQSPDEQSHTVAVKLEMELFDESARHTMEVRQAVVKNAVIETGREQDFSSLTTLAGKLYFKEALVARINQTVNFPLVRDIHLASFALR